jgi:hypothetical protein
MKDLFEIIVIPLIIVVIVYSFVFAGLQLSETKVGRCNVVEMIEK